MKQAADSTDQRRPGAVAHLATLLLDQSLRTRMLAYGLSRREQEIALLALRGLSNREIAERLYICEQTVKDHLFSIFSKLTIHRRGELAAKLLWLPSESLHPQFLLS